MFSREVARGEKDLETELQERGDEPRPYQYCPFCWRPVDVRLADTFFEATVWLRGLHKDSATLREYSGQAAHGDCVRGVSDQRRNQAPAPSDSDSSVVAVRDAEIPGQLAFDLGRDAQGNVTFTADISSQPGLVAVVASPNPFNGSIGHDLRTADPDGVLT